MSFLFYVVGFIVLIAGLAWGANHMGVAPVWIGIGSVILIGLGILTGAVKTRQRDPAEPIK